MTLSESTLASSFPSASDSLAGIGFEGSYALFFDIFRKPNNFSIAVQQSVKACFSLASQVEAIRRADHSVDLFLLQVRPRQFRGVIAGPV